MFWETFFLLMIFLPLMIVWVAAVADIFRRHDISGWSKALWVVCVFVFPFVGTLVYLLTQQRDAMSYERLTVRSDGEYRQQVMEPSNGVAQLSTLADLHDRGKLTDDEFAAQKARALGGGSAVPA